MRRPTAALLAVLLASATAVPILLPPSGGKLPQYRDASGNVPENSISEKLTIDVGDAKLGAILLGKRADAPVLLVCGGGPGIPEYLLESIYPSKLPEYFVVCYFDYRATGLSFDASASPGEMTTERYLDDVFAVTAYLQKRFGQEKLYIMGHSFGSYIALNAVYRRPENYAAYLAQSQLCSQRESEYRAYDYMYGQYRAMDDRAMLARFDGYPIHDSQDAYRKYCTSGLRDGAMHALGVGTAREMRSVVSGIVFPSLRSRAYTVAERVNIWRGKVNANRFAVTDEAFRFNAFDSITAVEVPVYFFAGAYDYTCCESLQREYCNALSAPEKRYCLYPNAAHSPIFEDAETTESILRELLGGVES